MQWLTSGLLQHMPAHTNVELLLRGDMPLSPNSILAILRSLPSLTCLSLEYVDKSIAEVVIVGLTGPEVQEDGSRRWLCPRLSSLGFEVCSDIRADLVLSMVQSRVQGSSPLDEGAGGGPLPFKELFVESSWTDGGTYNALRKLLGDEVLDWDDPSTEGKVDLIDTHQPP